MRFVRPLRLAWCFGSIAAGCTSDLKLSLEGLQCSADSRCSAGYACDKESRLCVRNALGQEPAPPGSDAGDAGIAMGGAGTGQGGVAGSASDAGSAGAGGNAGFAGQGGAGGSTTDLDAGVYDPVDGGDACVPALVYRDGDRDGFGDEDTSRMGCPGNGWVLDGTDCRDDIADVNPGQTGFFRISYFTPTGPSFDYDCSGVEEPSPDNDTNDPAPECPGLGLLVCEGSGFLPASDPPRSGPGIVDQRCGSTLLRDCQVVNGLACEPDDTEVSESLTFRCH